MRDREAYRRFLERTFETWAQFRVEVDELVDAGDAVVALGHTAGVGKASRAAVEERMAHVIWFRDGRPYRLKVFVDRDEALRAAGLLE
jgi:ketosteroid isomerase-like protein